MAPYKTLSLNDKTLSVGSLFTISANSYSSVAVYSIWCVFIFFSNFCVFFFCVFFFQAEDGIRDWSVTGVQTCALPISPALFAGPGLERRFDIVEARAGCDAVLQQLRRAAGRRCHGGHDRRQPQQFLTDRKSVV